MADASDQEFISACQSARAAMEAEARRGAGPFLLSYAYYFVFHLLACPFLAIRGLQRARKREYRGAILRRLAGGSLSCPRGSHVFIGSNLGETRTAVVAARQVQTVCAWGTAVAIHGMPSEAYARQLDAGLPLGFAPFNNPLSVLLFLTRVSPSTVSFVEYAELHHLVFWARLFGVPTLLVNVQLPESDIERLRLNRWNRWRMDGILIHAVQGARHKFTMERLGVPADRMIVVGPGHQIPFASSESRREAAAKWATEFHLEDRFPVIVAGSTYPHEEEMLMEAFAPIQQAYPRALLILAPRNMRREGGPSSLLDELRIPFSRRSIDRYPKPDDSIFLLDTLGELAEAYAAAILTYVGGSNVPEVGGHTPTEPLAWGKPMTMGPQYGQQQTLVDVCRDADILTICSTSTELTDTWTRLLSEPDLEKTMADRCAEVSQKFSQRYGKLFSLLFAKPGSA